MTGATAGMLSPQNIAVVTGAINREGDEGEILKETVKWGSLYLVICCVFLYVVGLVAGMDLMDEKLKSVLLSMKTQPDITGDVEAMTIIDHALSEIEQDIDLNKVIFKLNQEIDNYQLMHDFKLPSTLTKLKIMLDENPNKWTGAGLKGSI